MRRHQPAVKLCWRLLGLVRDDQLRIHAHVLTTIKSGESCDTPVPPRCARVSAGAGMGGWASLRATGWPSCGPSGPPAARRAVQHLSIVPAPAGVGGRELYVYRTSAFSWSLSNLVPNSRSTRSAISCQVRPAAFMSLRTANAFPSDRSSLSISPLFRLRKAKAMSRRRLLANGPACTPSSRGRTVALRRRGRSQYGLLQAGQRAGFLGVRGHQTLPHR